MYHSHLLINVGDNPDRPDWNITRRWLRNLYRVHQRLCMAFPSKIPASEAERIAAYCSPFRGEGLNDLRDLPVEPDTADVHHARSDGGGFLFRIDYPVDRERGVRRPIIIVQSARNDPPDWECAFGLDKNAIDDRGRPIGNASFLLAAPPQVKRVAIDVQGDSLVLTSPLQNHRIKAGDEVRFRLRANPVYTKDGKRHRPRIAPELFNASPAERDLAFTKAYEDWLQRKLGAATDALKVPTLVTSWSYGWRTKHEPQPKQRMQWWSVLFEGSFRVRDVEALNKLLATGIGPAKAFGFGLLSIAPVRQAD